MRENMILKKQTQCRCPNCQTPFTKHLQFHMITNSKGDVIEVRLL